MTIFYSMPKLLKLSNKNVDNIIELLNKGGVNIVGDSFIINPEKLLQARVTNKYKVEYLYLAAFRSYAEYVLLGIDYLCISNIPDIDVRKISRLNPLISVEDKIIKFNKEK